VSIFAPELPDLSMIRVVFCLLMFSVMSLSAQQPEKPDAAEIHQMIKKLNVLGAVLYVAAHPDDENQRLISYFANHKLFDVTYLSLTRGDGGQNLIGPELRELLGVLRTQELLMARSVDGGFQRFSRANDFGYSKTAEETLRIWDKDEVLSDVVWAIRQTQPDIIVNRFFHEERFSTHGHHTASAMLSLEAFSLAAQQEAFPEQLSFAEPWKAARVFFNTSWFFYGSREQFEQVDKTNLYPIDCGVYLPLKGKSNNEVAAEARSKHRCQGFGSMGSRGEALEWLDFVEGSKPLTKDPFEGINTTWSRLPEGAPIGALLSAVEQQFKPDNPSASVPDLLQAMQMIKALPDSYWKRRKLEDIKAVIRYCAGIYLESTANMDQASPLQRISIRLEAINRCALPFVLTSVDVGNGLFDTLPGVRLEDNKGWIIQPYVVIPPKMTYSSPYWLVRPYSNGMYQTPEQRLRGVADLSTDLHVRWSFTLNGVPLEYKTTVAYKKEESAVGEVWRPFDVLPPVFVACTESNYVFREQDKSVLVQVTAGRDSLVGEIALNTSGQGFVVSTPPKPFFFERKGAMQTFEFLVQAGSGTTFLEPVARVSELPYTQRLVTIDYDHIPRQHVLLSSRTPAFRTDVRTLSKHIGYFMGAGDDLPKALGNIGCSVTLLKDDDIVLKNLIQYDAIVLGIRAYNTKASLKFHHPVLMDYVQQGGTLVVQYNTSGELVVPNPAPFPIKISRTRVTDETAPVRFLLPDHPVLNSPNTITTSDFEGWEQERGLYFIGDRDAAFSAPLSMNDPGEKPADGSLLIAPYGRGHFVYTSLSFFRELPAGVPGAYRLFANLISLGK
jgi:LmbE family N-acetylglucosaminyl deacetylase